MPEHVPVLKVLKILDEKTLVVGGNGLDLIREGSELTVLAIGPKLEELGNLPLVVEKARIEVVTHAGQYAIASSPEIKKEVSSPSTYDLITGKRTRTVTVRESLPVEDKEVIGNPANRPIHVGDPVIRPEDLKYFVEYLSKNM